MFNIRVSKYSQCFLIIMVLLLALAFAPHSFAASDSKTVNINNYPDAVKMLRTLRVKYDYNTDYATHVIRRGKYNPAVIRAYQRRQKDTPWSTYQAAVITPELVQQGADFWKKRWKIVAWAGKEYGVQPSILVALYGLSSQYGKRQGHYNELDTLVTLAFHNPPTEKKYIKELRSYLLLTRQFRLSPYRLNGSSDGRLGQAQFLPTSFLYYASHFRINASPNMFNNSNDALFSLGNYLMQMHWSRDEAVAAPAQVTGNISQLVKQAEANHGMTKSTLMKNLKQQGVTPKGYYHPNKEASLIVLNTDNGPQYWIGYHNFNVLAINRGSNFAMAVYQLAGKIKAEREARLEEQEKTKDEKATDEKKEG